MINPAQIPPEVVEAAVSAYNYASSDCYTSQEQDMRAAIAAGLNAWPNAKTLRDDGRRQTYIVPALILPFSTETSNDR